MGVGSSTYGSGSSRNRPHSYSGPSSSSSAGGRGLGPRNEAGGFGTYFRDGRFRNRNDNIDVMATIPEGPEEVRKTLLDVKDYDFLILDNAIDHHTTVYDLVLDERSQRLLIRRGQTFTFQLTFDRPYNKDEDRIAVVFQTGKSPSQMDGSKVVLPLYKKPRSKTWSIEVVEQNDNKVTFKVKVSAKCPIGTWKVGVNSMNKNDQEPALVEWKCPKPIYIIFNPWCEEDTVYCSDPNYRKRYVEKDDGKIYVGSRRRIYGRNWNFAQFEDPVIQCVIYILEEVGPALRPSAMADAVKVVRKLTSVVNACDNNGILVGNWSGDYSGGTSPVAWDGSEAILQEYWETKKSVKFGQCWVFSGLLTTCCRAIGIPARSVTNFSSAHDTDVSLTIDRYETDSKEEWLINYVESMNSDSIWNFHVWNDAWMTRPDLSGDFAGWQACDSTPQESSDGLMCCGPCPLKAIKEGQVNMSYDGAFIFAEVNGDVIDWEYNVFMDEYSIININNNTVGKNISTLGDDDKREDVTDQYKHGDFAKERETFTKAIKSIPSASHKREELAERYAMEEEQPDVSLEFVDLEDVLYGNTYTVKLRITNICKEKRTVDVRLGSKSVYYTGLTFKPVKSETFSEALEGGEYKILQMPVTYDEYEPCISENCIFKISSRCKVQETGKVYSNVDDFDLSKPEMKVTLDQPEVKVGETVKVKASFVNSLPKSLTNGVLAVSGIGLQRKKTFKMGPVAGKERLDYEFDIKPFKKGKRMLLLDFESTQMIGVKGSCEVLVIE